MGKIGSYVGLFSALGGVLWYWVQSAPLAHLPGLLLLMMATDAPVHLSRIELLPKIGEAFSGALPRENYSVLTMYAQPPRTILVSRRAEVGMGEIGE